MYLLSIKHIYCSSACAINLGSTVILTGGLNSRTKVSEYGEAGFIRYLPDLNQGRRQHGCSHYEDGEGRKVNIDINYSSLILVQTYLVSGGNALSSTEVLLETGSAWTLTGDLPSPRAGLRGANIKNMVLMTGN